MAQMTRDEFYEQFPWVFSLPERPQCSECWSVSFWTIDGDGNLTLHEHHRPGCSRAEHDGEVHVIAKRGET